MPSSPANEGEPHDGAEVATQEPQQETDREGDLRAEVAELDDRYKRALADLDNYRKRAARETDRRVQERSDALLHEFLEALDSIERALEHISEEAREGLRAVRQQMEAILTRHGVTRVGTPGDRFDPELHEAIGVRETDDVPDRTIVEVARSGYAVGGRVLRPAQVIVARSPGE
jgi:molecular chaperone GrpE